MTVMKAVDVLSSRLVDGETLLSRHAEPAELQSLQIADRRCCQPAVAVAVIQRSLRQAVDTLPDQQGCLEDHSLSYRQPVQIFRNLRDVMR